MEKYNEIISTDFESFHFNLNANGRLPQPMKYELKHKKFGGYRLFEQSNDNLILLASFGLPKANSHSQLVFMQHGYFFDFHSIEFPLCKETLSNDYVIKRIFVIQMNPF